MAKTGFRVLCCSDCFQQIGACSNGDGKTTSRNIKNRSLGRERMHELFLRRVLNPVFLPRQPDPTDFWLKLPAESERAPRFWTTQQSTHRVLLRLRHVSPKEMRNSVHSPVCLIEPDPHPLSSSNARQLLLIHSLLQSLRLIFRIHRSARRKFAKPLHAPQHVKQVHARLFIRRADAQAHRPRPAQITAL
eukprot:CAMPEP_0185830754 /NCGR_PEP_ID=MMETSP1353-20130828/1058_1 /TAXON_ID=1077150 /ORGANISM="Erythrolobus australicus, Strain CCMP3124" /LENGTH=189 /DNA_ID=CAMNT_0028528727 /DNA_START=236 /DNA_END=805 /DNA_ORIENTATION=+